MIKFCSLSVICCMACILNASQARVQQVEQSFSQDAIQDLVGQSAHFVGEAWARVLFDNFSPIARAYEDVQQQVANQMDENNEFIICYRLLDGGRVIQENNRTARSRISRLPSVKDNKLLLVGMSNGSYYWIIGGRRGQLINDYNDLSGLEGFLPLIQRLYAHLSESRLENAQQVPPLQLTQEETMLFQNQDPAIQRNMRSNYKFTEQAQQQQQQAAQNQQAANLAAAVVAVAPVVQAQPQDQQPAVNQPRVLQNPVADNEAVDNLRHRGQPAQPSVQPGQPQNHPAPVVAPVRAQEGWGAWSWKWSKRGVGVGVLLGAIYVAGAPTAALAGGKALALKLGIAKAAPIVIKAAWWKIGLLGV